MDLETCRAKIETIDADILKLLNKRFEVAEAIGKIKANSGLPLHAPNREEVLLKKLESLNSGKLPKEALRAIYREIISYSLAFQEPNDSVSENR